LPPLYHQQTKNLLVVKANQPGLHQQLRSLPWKNVTARRYDRERGHGRNETRVIRVLTVTGLGLDFPHAVQAARVTRHRTDAATGKRTRQTVYALTDLTHEQASPQFIGRLPRTQWTIEDRLHFIRGHRLPRGHLKDPHRPRAGEHGHPAQPGRQRAPEERPHQNARLVSATSPTTPSTGRSTYSGSPNGSCRVVETRCRSRQQVSTFIA
jgi:hypothetical protein